MVNKNLNDAMKDRVDELIEKGQLLPKQQDGLSKMLDSPDSENATLAKDIIALNTKDLLKVGLNEEQVAAFDSIIEFLDDAEEDAFVLKGYAGTGKTFLVQRIIEYIISTFPKERVAITAPTNKAVRVLEVDNPFNPIDINKKPVLKDVFNGRNRVNYYTVHKLLGLKEQISDGGVQSFAVDSLNKSTINEYKFLVVDEVSMLDDELCHSLMQYADKINIIFMGDPAQIPPVKKIDSIPLRKQDEYNFKVAILRKIMRQTGEHPIVDASFLIRNNLRIKQPIPKLETILNKEEKGIIFVNAETEKNTIAAILKKYFNTPKFDTDSDYAKVIAWTNDRVDYFNKIIRQIRYGKDAAVFEVGEKLIANKPIFKELPSKWGSRWTIAMTTSDEMEVIRVEINNKRFNEGNFKLYLKIYELTVNVWDMVNRRTVESSIQVIHEDSIDEYEKAMADAKNLAKRLKSKAAWIPYYNMQKWSANVGYNYAITAHKAQGSTYTIVFLDEENIDKNPNVLERNRIKYTAYSRPTHLLYILRKNYAL